MASHPGFTPALYSVLSGIGSPPPHQDDLLDMVGRWMVGSIFEIYHMLMCLALIDKTTVQ